MAGNLKASPRSRSLGALSDFVQRLKDKANTYEVKDYVPLLGGTGLGDLFIGKTPEEINEWAYGNLPFHIPATSNIPQLKQGRGEQLLDTMFSAGDAAALAKLGPKAVRAALDRAVQTSSRSPLAQVGAIKPRGGNWLPEGVEDSLKAKLTGRADEKGVALDKWIQGPLRKYIMRDMATPEDPIRKLADEGILHVDPQELNFNMSTYGKWPQEGQEFLAKSDVAKAWEGVTDNAITNMPKHYFEEGSSRMLANPWIKDLPDDSIIHGLEEPRNFMEDTGLDRLHQGVYDALLEGTITPQQLNSGSFSVEAAVRMAHQKRMAELAAKEAELLKNSRNAATHVFKEYPDNNPEGFHWVQIRKPELNPEYSVKDPIGSGFRVFDAKDLPVDPSITSSNSAEEALKEHLRVNPQYRNQLQQALSHEGEVMGHCVGDYCDDVASGTTGIYSLRDKKGKSHVTIETRKSNDPVNLEQEAWEAVAREHPGVDPDDLSDELIMDKMIQLSRDNENKWFIQQIKGSGKKDPTQAILKEDIPKYQPYLKDFLNSQSWSDVRDLKNTGLIDIHSQYGPEASQFRFLTPEEQAALHASNPSLQSKMGKALDDPNFNDGWEPDEEIEFAEGGLVRQPEHFDNLDMFLRRQDGI